MKQIFLGPPGSGKGTYSKRIAPKYNIPHISTGDLLREHIKNQTEIGKKVMEYTNQGKLVPDEIIIEIIKERINKEDCQKGFILDGFPRTIKQAKTLKEITEIRVVFNLVIPEEILIEKICARRVCKNCGEIYNLAEINKGEIRMPAMKPKVENICDKCKGPLIQRDDDNEETVKKRLKVYKEQTQPLIEFYKQENLLKDIYITGPPEEMAQKIIEELEKIKSNLS